MTAIRRQRQRQRQRQRGACPATAAVRPTSRRRRSVRTVTLARAEISTYVFARTAPSSPAQRHAVQAPGRCRHGGNAQRGCARAVQMCDFRPHICAGGSGAPCASCLPPSGRIDRPPSIVAPHRAFVAAAPPPRAASWPVPSTPRAKKRSRLRTCDGVWRLSKRRMAVVFRQPSRAGGGRSDGERCELGSRKCHGTLHLASSAG